MHVIFVHPLLHHIDPAVWYWTDSYILVPVIHVVCVCTIFQIQVCLCFMAYYPIYWIKKTTIVSEGFITSHHYPVHLLYMIPLRNAPPDDDVAVFSFSFVFILPQLYNGKSFAHFFPIYLQAGVCLYVGIAGIANPYVICVCEKSQIGSNMLWVCPIYTAKV